MVLLQTADF